MTTQAEQKKPRLQSSKHDAEARDDSEEPPMVQKTPRAQSSTIQICHRNHQE